MTSRYDYDAIYHRLVVRMPTAVHELFVACVEDAIFSQLKSIRKGSDSAAAFARKVYPTRSTEIYLPVDDATPDIKSKHEPDASFAIKMHDILVLSSRLHIRKRKRA